MAETHKTAGLEMSSGFQNIKSCRSSGSDELSMVQKKLKCLGEKAEVAEKEENKKVKKQATEKPEVVRLTIIKIKPLAW